MMSKTIDTMPAEDHSNNKQKRATKRKRSVIAKDLHTDKYRQRIKQANKETYKRVRNQDLKRTVDDTTNN